VLLSFLLPRVVHGAVQQPEVIPPHSKVIQAAETT
jgi:hypothetical protein